MTSPLVGCALALALLTAPVTARGAEVVAAAAANLATVLRPLAAAWERDSGVRVTLTFAATGALARQLEHGAPFDVFLSADTATVDALVARGVLDGATRRVFARGALVVWSPPGAGFVPGDLSELRDARLRRLAVANPAVAPYGAAARSALAAAGLWEAVEPRLVITQNVADARHVAATGNADAAFVSLSLVVGGPGSALRVDPALHPPLDHALALVAAGRGRADAQRFVAFLLGTEGRRALAAAGYEVPAP